MKIKKEKGKKYMGTKARIIVSLQERNDLTVRKLTELLNKPEASVRQAMTELRKSGYRIWPSKGPGTPLKIATTEADAAKYIAWRRGVYLDTTRRMIVTEMEIGEQYRQLASSPKQLLKVLNEVNPQ